MTGAAYSAPEVLPLIGGRWHGNGTDTDLYDPADPAKLVAHVRSSTTDDVAAAFESAQRAALSWARTPALERSRILYAAADNLDARADHIATQLVREEGKLLRDARGEVERSASTLRYYAGLLLMPTGSVYPPESATLSVSRRHPVGIVGVITPFNYPLLLPAWKIGPALALGNVVVWKCSELTPATAVEFASAFVDAGLPPGVLNLVIGGGTVGTALVGGPLDALTFTGSTAVGARLGAMLASRRVRLQLELGGKNHAIVLDDADPAFAASRIAYGAMSAAGQKCTAIEVAVVEDGVYDDVRAHLIQSVERLRAGQGLDPETTLPPLVSATAASRVRGTIAGAHSRGGRILTGGAAPPLERGHFVAPTIIEGLERDDPFLRDEVFGPVVALVPARSDADAVAIASSGTLGLNAGVFSRDVSRGLDVCEQLTSGMVHFNDVTGFPPHIPFGGSQGSAFGPLEQGDTVREFFTETRMLHIHQHPAPGGSR
jgi:aldehyde dehydrogenase (NAD+)